MDTCGARLWGAETKKKTRRKKNTRILTNQEASGSSFLFSVFPPPKKGDGKWYPTTYGVTRTEYIQSYSARLSIRWIFWNTPTHTHTHKFYPLILGTVERERDSRKSLRGLHFTPSLPPVHVWNTRKGKSHRGQKKATWKSSSEWDEERYSS